MDLAELSLNEIEHQQQFNDPSPSLTNTQLTSSQKQHKKNLKTELKFQRKVQKLESRIAHAISRKDVAVEQQARKDLDELLRSKTCDHYQSLSTRFPSSDNADGTGSNHVDVVQDAAIKEVTQIFRTLLTSIGKHDRKMAANGSTKEVQNSKARNLLQHMTKGTQTSDMFRDVAALRGYVRKKFHGRASLIIKSFSELSPEALQMACTKPIENMSVSDRLKSQNQRDIMSICYDKLSQIKRVCSIGCGPGNDVVGLISILRTMLSSKMTKPEGGADECSTEITEPQLTEVLLLDFAMKEWNEAALNDLIPILVPRYVKRISSEHCDVTMPLFSPCKGKSEEGSESEEGNNTSVAKFVQNTDIFLTSYLLTETRYSWDLFYVQLVQLAPVGALFYFAEPMAWQLHRLIRMSTQPSVARANCEHIDYSPLFQLKFVWIDSSMHYPELQQMDGRAGGPAVLLAIKL
ncbi:hypothetical protein HJC23_005383 [Cyclotella cryptica]|uniref:Uncharacterized protein n=1 Tax=Cyclotella cryptica TaxID=29204 RepID=A0ABD3P429_9STRA